MEIKVKNSGIIELPKIDDHEDGTLIILEQDEILPFPMKRIYYINRLNENGSMRGKHAHYTLSQVIFCVSGAFTLGLDDGTNKQEIRMDQDNLGVILGPMLWHTMFDFTNDCIILVVASDKYDEADYIRNYEEFLRECARINK